MFFFFFKHQKSRKFKQRVAFLMKLFSLLKTLLHSFHFSHFSMATSWQPGPGPWGTELVRLQRVSVLSHSGRSRATIQASDSQESFFQPNTLSFSERSSQETTKSWWKIPSCFGQLWVSWQIFKKKISSDPLKGKRCLELGLERNSSSSCAHPRPVAIAPEINESQGKHSGKWWQLYVQIGSWLPSQPTTISLPSAINLTQLWGVSKPV